LMGYSGMRLGEATSVKWRPVNFESGDLLITGGEDGTKNHHERTIPLFPALRKFLLDLREEQMKRLKLRRLDEFQVVPILNAKTAMNTACEEANLPHFNHHHCR